ncbi:hypothetical protein SAMN05216559_1052 [Halomicrobium zhouii]|uniref:Uncharacterized protein n=1 Tax=Halomicrobium zhouii TaxID=767519 RepID=A0A1I6KM63_9EURY|nr:hypothetical protein [Halomicrobium zhouii]SFR92345.1 hypothetical protein SAMN05216559_1052 [Halomicrobium zhouii]
MNRRKLLGKFTKGAVVTTGLVTTSSAASADDHYDPGAEYWIKDYGRESECKFSQYEDVEVDTGYFDDNEVYLNTFEGCCNSGNASTGMACELALYEQVTPDCYGIFIDQCRNGAALIHWYDENDSTMGFGHTPKRWLREA